MEMVHGLDLQHVGWAVNPAVASIAAVLTAIGWGGGELIGHGVNRYLSRRNVKRWLAAERAWRSSTVRQQIRPGRPVPNYGVLAESIRNNPSVVAMVNEEMVKHGLASPGDLYWPLRQVVGGYTDRFGREAVLYKDDIGAGRVRFTQESGGRIVKAWDYPAPIRHFDWAKTLVAAGLWSPEEARKALGEW